MTSKPKILIVDDDESVRKSIGLWLRGEGFTVFTTAGGAEAAEIAKEKDIAICLVDLKLKEEDGLQVCRKLIEIDALMKILIITAFPGYQSAIQAMKSGIYDYISKSESNDEIIKKIDDALHERTQELEAKEHTKGEKKNIILICHHSLVKEGIKSFCKEYREFNLLHSYNTIDLIKKYDFNLRANLVLICDLCHHNHIEEESKKVFSSLNLFFPNAKKIIINSSYNDSKKKKLLFHQVKGFLPENIPGKELNKSLNLVLQGQIWVDRKLSDGLLSQLLEELNHGEYVLPTNPFGLSSRELEVLQAVATGLSNYEISEKLYLSEKTVKTHIHNIFKKMKVSSRTQAVMKAVKHYAI